MLAECDLGIAMDAFWKGRVHLACRYFDEALLYAEETVYPMPHIRAQAAVFFRYMQRISSTAYSNVLDEAAVSEYACRTPFAGYVESLEAMDRDDPSVAARYEADYPDEQGFFSAHLRIRLLMRGEDHEGARALLTELLNGEAPLNEIELYAVLSDLEICCRETDDYREAYRYSNERVQLLEQLLKN